VESEEKVCYEELVKEGERREERLKWFGQARPRKLSEPELGTTWRPPIFSRAFGYSLAFVTKAWVNYRQELLVEQTRNGTEPGRDITDDLVQVGRPCPNERRVEAVQIIQKKLDIKSTRHFRGYGGSRFDYDLSMVD
jgi:hypothetical protein